MTKTIAIGDRVLFTNPATGQQLVGTVERFDDSRPRPMLVKFDSFMFVSQAEAHDSRAFVAPEDCRLIP